MDAVGARRVTSSDGVKLAVYQSGAPDAPTVLLVHGYPDNHAVWDGVAELLAARFSVVTYDVRGTGASDQPRPVRAYRIPQLVADLLAVVQAVSPNRPVHLVGHDWGSVQCWPALVDERLAGRIATFTSISGPSLDYSGAWLRRSHEHPLESLRQVGHSYYVGLFQLPGLPELAIRRGLLDRGLARISARSPGGAGGPGPAAGTGADKLNGGQLSRANVGGRLRRPRPGPADLPGRLVVPEQAPFVTPARAIGSARPWVADLTVRRLGAGHWVVSDRPELIAELIEEFAGPGRPVA